jgi:hypothetical protein
VIPLPALLERYPQLVEPPGDPEFPQDATKPGVAVMTYELL